MQHKLRRTLDFDRFHPQLRRERAATTATQVSRPVERILLSVSIYRLFPIDIRIHIHMLMEEMPAVVSQVLA